MREIVKEWLVINTNIKTYAKMEDYIDAIVLGGYRQANISASTYSKYNKNLLPEKPKQKIPLNYILDCLNKAYCTHCHTLKDKNEFYSNKSRTYGLNGFCKICDYKFTRVGQPLVQANRKAAKLLRTPVWSNSLAIKEIYLKCPKGQHVDHVVPLQGKLVSGLHVDNNLQYLIPEDNIQKGNRYKIL